MMAGLDNISRGEFAEMKRQIRDLQTAAGLQAAAIGSGGLEVYGGGGITIENGGLYVNGSATIIGALNADGTINMRGVFIATGDVKLNGPTDVTGNFTVTGPTKLDGKTDIGGDTTVTGDLNVHGPLDVTGATKLDGKTDIGGNTAVDGTLDIKGKSTLQNDLTVQGGGKIKAGGVTVDPSRFNGGVVFDTGSYVAGTPNGAQFVHPSGGAVTVAPGQADLGVAGGGAIIARGTGLFMNGIPLTSEKPNLHIDSNGKISRSTAT